MYTMVNVACVPVQFTWHTFDVAVYCEMFAWEKNTVLYSFTALVYFFM